MFASFSILSFSMQFRSRCCVSLDGQISIHVLKSSNNIIIVNEKWKSWEKKSSTIGYSFAESNWNRMSMTMTMTTTSTDGNSEPIKTFIVHSDLIRWFHLLNFLILFTFRLFICCHIGFDLIWFDFQLCTNNGTAASFSLWFFLFSSRVYIAICHIFMCACTKWHVHFDWSISVRVCVCFVRWVGWLLYSLPRYFKTWWYQSTFRTNVAIRYNSIRCACALKFTEIVVLVSIKRLREYGH